MVTDKQAIEAIILLDTKERMLGEIIVWLKAKGLWEECQKSLSIKVIPTMRKDELGEKTLFHQDTVPEGWTGKGED
jgi:hypothetical protein